MLKVPQCRCGCGHTFVEHEDRESEGGEERRGGGYEEEVGRMGALENG